MLLLRDTSSARMERNKTIGLRKRPQKKWNVCIILPPIRPRGGSGTCAKSILCFPFLQRCVKRCVLEAHAPGSQSCLGAETSPAPSAKLITAQMFNPPSETTVRLPCCRLFPHRNKAQRNQQQQVVNTGVNILYRGHLCI